MENLSVLTPGMQVGDYLLKELLTEGEVTRMWYAEQVSVKREVIVESLRSAILTDEKVKEAFLDDVRAKAKVDHPLIGSVFETVQFEGVCFYARERLSGDTLEQYAERGQTVSPSEAAHILKQIAEANLYLDSQDIGSLSLGANHIYIGEKGLTRLVNMAIAEPRDHSVSIEEKKMLGDVFSELLDRNVPGATRINSLCDFMSDTEREIPITWEQIRDLSDQVEKQLREQPSSHLNHQPSAKQGGKSVVKNIAIVAVIALVALGIIGFVTMKMVAPKPTVGRDLTRMVVIDVPEVSLRSETVKLTPFSINAHEITISEYALFLSAVEENGMEAYAVSSMPPRVKSFAPGGQTQWEEMYEAAKGGLVWSKTGQVMDVNQPVMFVNFWMAKAFANWKTESVGDGIYDLPTEAQWLAAIADEDLTSLKVDKWGAADANDADVSSKGIHGLAGGVSLT